MESQNVTFQGETTPEYITEVLTKNYTATTTEIAMEVDDATKYLEGPWKQVYYICTFQNSYCNCWNHWKCAHFENYKKSHGQIQWTHPDGLSGSIRYCNVFGSSSSHV